VRAAAGHDDLRVLEAGVQNEATDAQVAERSVGQVSVATAINAIHHDHTQLSVQPPSTTQPGVYLFIYLFADNNNHAVAHNNS